MSTDSYRKAIELLARRQHFRLELERKLQSRGFEADDIDETLARLTGEALIDDAEAARTFVSSRLRRGSIGPRKLWAQLRQRGVDQEVAQSTIDALVDDETELALAAAERWQRRRSRATTSDRDGLARHLNSAGFNSGSIVTALRAVLDDPS